MHPTLKLNVGCGSVRDGDVNLDVGPIEHSCGDTPGRTVADIYADGQHLPFRNKVFGSVLASHVIEHVDDPNMFVRELERVAWDIEIRTPHWLSPSARVPFHKWAMHVSWFRKKGYNTELTTALYYRKAIVYPAFKEIIARKKRIENADDPK